MNFDEAQKRFSRLAAQRRHGHISEEQYTAAVNELRVVDPSGVWWQPDPASGGWIFWNGTAWVQGTPPQQAGPVQGAKATPAGASTVRDDSGKFMDLKTFRQVARSQPMAQRPQRWFDLLSILAGVIVAVLWFMYVSIRASSEGFDFFTPLLLVGIPVVLALYRGRIDGLLLSIQPFRKRLSRPVLLGLGIATPFLTAFLLFNVFGFSNYALLHWNIIVGTLLAYAIVREPVLAPGGGNSPRMNGRVPLMLLLVCSLCVTGAMADDCEKDPFNAQDCLRTAGYAQMIAGIVSATSGLFVNFPTFIQSVTPQGGKAEHDWRKRNEDDFDKFVNKKREGYHYDKNLDAWVKDSELQNLQQQRTQKQQELDGLQSKHTQRVKNQQKNILSGVLGGSVPGQGDEAINKASQAISQEQQKLADENAQIKKLQDDINKLDSDISYQKTRQQFHQQK